MKDKNPTRLVPKVKPSAVEAREPSIVPVINIENAKIVFRNFSGKEGRYNAAGRRNFCVLLDPTVAEDLANMGWNIKRLKARDPADPDQPYLQVTVSYKNHPPKIVVITSRKKTILDESSVHVLDWAEISNVDLVIRPYSWEVNGKTGLKAYAKSMYITLVEDEFESKYVDVPDAAVTSHSDEDGD